MFSDEQPRAAIGAQGAPFVTTAQEEVVAELAAVPPVEAAPPGVADVMLLLTPVPPLPEDVADDEAVEPPMLE